MSLEKKDIKHIALLARLDLNSEELKIYGQQLSDVLDYIAKLQEVDVINVEPTAQVTGLINVLREDKVENWKDDEVAAALKQAPSLEGRQIKVKRILE